MLAIVSISYSGTVTVKVAVMVISGIPESA